MPLRVTAASLVLTLIILAFASSTSVLAPPPAYACTCATRPISEYIESSSSTFTGKVESIQPSPTGGYYVGFTDVFRVWGVWVNDQPSDGKATVWTRSLGAGDCGYPFEEGQEYLVYTERHEISNLLEVDLCNGTKSIGDAEEDLQVLGTGTNPTLAWRATPVPATHSGQIFTAADFILPTLYGAGAFAAAWLFFRYKGKGGKPGPVFAGIAVGLAFVFVFTLVYGGYIDPERLSEGAQARENEHLVCSTISGFRPYHRAEIAESIAKESDMMIVIGTITNVETKQLDFYSAETKFDPSTSEPEVVGYVPTGKKIPWKVVTLEVEKYLIDEAGRYSGEVTFRTPANACVDNSTGEVMTLPASFDSDPASDPDSSPKYNVGDRSLMEIHRWPGSEYKAEGLDAESIIKLDIDENGFVKPDYRTGIDEPIKIEDLEKEITAEIEKLKAQPKVQEDERASRDR